MPLSNEGIDAIASAIFDRPAPFVVEAYSAYDREPLAFDNAGLMTDYVRDCLASKDAFAYLFVVYPDMAGCASKKTIRLNPAKTDGHTFRYSWSGWGLIQVQLSNRPAPNHESRIASSSEKRAIAWAHTYPELPAPSTWNWKAVASHTRRLKRVLAQHSG